MNDMFKCYLKVIIVLIIIFTGCQKVEKSRVPTLTTTTVTNITSNAATSGGKIITQFELLTYGLCWSTRVKPTLDDNVTRDTLGFNSIYTIKITDLISSTKYYVRAYAINTYGVGYGNELSFTTQPTSTQ